MANEIADLKAHIAGLTKRREELIAEVRAAEKAARDYRDLILDAEIRGELSPKRRNQRVELDDKHTAVFETYESCNYP